jgi:hypothetical protein
MMQRPRAVVFITLAVASASAACQRADAPIRDPIPDIPTGQQRVVSRQDFHWKWPFSVGHGTLGCTENAIVFRNEGKTYALNAAARSRGFALVDPIWRWQSAGLPRDPLRKLAQNDRQTVFAQLMACDGDGSIETRAQTALCKQNLARARGLTDPLRPEARSSSEVGSGTVVTAA